MQILTQISPSLSGPRIRPPDVPERVPAVEAERLLGPVVRGPLHPHQGHAQGARGARAAQGDHGAAEDEAGVVGHRLGRRAQVRVRGLLPPGGQAQR